jgi:hypothetical protein
MVRLEDDRLWTVVRVEPGEDRRYLRVELTRANGDTRVLEDLWPDDLIRLEP